ncbi:MAG TPA: DUF4364 family protein [Tissierellia bacterium]|nr:DUF4364 family protein [Tissierellia bacterium]
MQRGNKIAQDKLKLLYILNYIDLPLTNNEITNYIMEYNIFDYFTLQLLLDDLLEDKFTIIKNISGNEYYSVSETGKTALEMFSHKLPEYFKEEVEENFSHLKKLIEKQRELFGHYYQRKDGEYTVSLQVMENGSNIFNLNISVPTEESAKMIVKNWNNSPHAIFGQIVKLLTSNNE